ncbi:MAG: GIY-YIG nuclease family protein [Bacteroidota bacterium]
MSLFDYRYVYVFKVRGERLYKIGISKDWKIRRYQIEDSRRIRMRLRILIALPLLRAGKIEKKLHRKFSRFHAPIKGVSGGTEFYRLNGYDGRVGLRGELLKYFFFQLGAIILLFVGLGLWALGIDIGAYLNAMLESISL